MIKVKILVREGIEIALLQSYSSILTAFHILTLIIY